MPQEYDPARGKAAFDKLRPRIEAVPEAQVSRPFGSPEEAAFKAMQVVATASSDELRPTFAALPAVLWDQAHLDELEDLAWALLYVRNEGLSAQAAEDRRLVPAEIVDEAGEVRERMLKVVEYHLGGHPAAGPEVAAIRSGVGRLDTAHDLARLARLYEAHSDVVTKDPSFYRASDAADARRLSDAIFEALATNSSREWTERLFRVWTLFRVSYDEVRAAATFVLRHEPHRLERFPALGSRARSPRSTPAATPTPASEPQPAPAPE